jgi:ADP-ribose pyrophosphatase YjhB (NUDIX family)
MKPSEIVPAEFASLKPKPLPGFENSGDIYWHKLGRASIDFAALKDSREDRTRLQLKAPNKPWYRALNADPRFTEIRSFCDPTGKTLLPNRFGHPDFKQAFAGYPEIPIEGQGDELGEIFTEAADTIILREGESGIEVMLIQRASGYFALPGGIRAQVNDSKLYEIDSTGVYRQLPAAKETAIETARRSLRDKAGTHLPVEAFSHVVYSGIVDDIRNSNGAALYSTVFSLVDEQHQIKLPKGFPPEICACFVPVQSLLRNHNEPTLGGLWGSHAYFLKLALWAEYVVLPARFQKLSSEQRDVLRQTLAYDPLDTLLAEEVSYAAQNQWASGQWTRRVPWPVRGSLMSPLDGGQLLSGMEKLQGHPGLVPAWIMKKSRRLHDYSIDDLRADLELHRDNHSDIPEQVQFSYLSNLKQEAPERIQQWLQYLGKEALEANHVWVSSALAILKRLGIDKKNLGLLESGDDAMESLLEFKRQLMAIEAARSIAELVQMLTENDQACDYMVTAHTAWREPTYGLPAGSLTTDPYRRGERPAALRKLVKSFSEEVISDGRSFKARLETGSAGELTQAAAKTLAGRVANLRQTVEKNPAVSGAQSFNLMLQIGSALEELAANDKLPLVFRAQIRNQLADLVFVVKMDANSAVVSGILNAARKQGAKVKYKIEPE